MEIYWLPDGTWNVNNWNDAVSFCQSKNQTLASWSDWCGTDFSLADLGEWGMINNKDEWAPIEDYPNGYIQVGDTSGYSYDHPQCRSHRDGGHGDPAWGLDNEKEEYEASYILCRDVQGRADQFLYGPEDGTTSGRSWDEAAAFCVSRIAGSRLATKDEYCSATATVPLPVRVGDVSDC